MSASAATGIRQRLEDGHFRTEAAPHAAQLQADHARADHAQALRHGAHVERAGVVEDQLVVVLGEGQLDRHRAGGDDDVLGGNLRDLAVVALDADHAVRLERGEAGDRRDGLALMPLNSVVMPPVNCFTILSLRAIIVARPSWRYRR
jgi:hypothetical protein